MLDAQPSQDRVDPCDHLGQSERLGHVVVAADGEAGHLVLDRVAGGEEEDGALHAVRAEAAGDLEAVEVGEHDVEDDQVGRMLLCDRQGLAAVDGLG